MVKDNSSPFDLRVSNEIGRFFAVLSLIIHVWIIRLRATPQLLNISTSLLSKIKREERMFFYTVLFRCRKKLQAKEKQLPAEKTNTSYNFCVRGFSGLEGRQKLCTLWPSLLQPGGSWPSGVSATRPDRTTGTRNARRQCTSINRLPMHFGGRWHLKISVFSVTYVQIRTSALLSCITLSSASTCLLKTTYARKKLRTIFMTSQKVSSQKWHAVRTNLTPLSNRAKGRELSGRLPKEN